MVWIFLRFMCWAISFKHFTYTTLKTKYQGYQIDTYVCLHMNEWINQSWLRKINALKNFQRTNISHYSGYIFQPDMSEIGSTASAICAYSQTNA